MLRRGATRARRRPSKRAGDSAHRYTQLVKIGFAIREPPVRGNPFTKHFDKRRHDLLVGPTIPSTMLVQAPSGVLWSLRLTGVLKVLSKSYF